MFKKKYTEKQVRNIVFNEIEKREIKIKKEKEERNISILKSTFLLDELYIFRSNEWEDISIRRVIGYENDNTAHQELAPILEDIVTKEIILNYTETFKPYSDGLLKTLCKLNAYEQYTVMNKTGINLINKPIDNDFKDSTFRTYEEWNDIILKYKEDLELEESSLINNLSL